MTIARDQRRRVSLHENTDHHQPRRCISLTSRLTSLLAAFLIGMTGLATWPAHSAEEPASATVPPELQGKPWRQMTAQIEADRHRIRKTDAQWQANTPSQLILASSGEVCFFK